MIDTLDFDDLSTGMKVHFSVTVPHMMSFDDMEDVFGEVTDVDEDFREVLVVDDDGFKYRIKYDLTRTPVMKTSPDGDKSGRLGFLGRVHKAKEAVEHYGDCF